MSSTSRTHVESRARNSRTVRAEPPRLAARQVPAVPAVVGGPDPVILWIVVVLVSFGVMMVYSASSVLAYTRYNNGQYFLFRQAGYAVAALFAMLTLSRLDYQHLRQWAYPVLIASIIPLALTASAFGRSANGAARWITVAQGIHFQPAEFAKLAMIIWLSYSLAKKAASIRTFSIGFMPHLVVAAVMIVLCLRQPDFGSAVMIGLLTLILMFTAGARLGYMLATGLLALPLLHHLIVDSPYRWRRVTAYLQPFQDRYGLNYQVAESLLGFGAGGATGVGIGDSHQKLLFLPEAHTDFISAIVGEELGFIGIGLMITAYLVLMFRGVRAAYRAADDFGTYLAIGITLFIGLQAFINLGVALGLLPTKGLVLPFISYGGNALLVNCAAAGILLSVSRPRATARAAILDEGAARPNARVAQAGGMA